MARDPSAGADHREPRVRGWTPCLVLALAAAVSLGAPAVFRPAEVLVRTFHDDAFYYFQVARNVAHGAGFTFDGIHATNGFHPLWLSVLVPLFAIVPGDVPPLRAVLLLQTAVGSIATVLLFRLLSRRIAPPAAFAAAASLIGLPFAAMSICGGMESALLLALLVWVWWCWEAIGERGTDAGLRCWLLLGVACAAALLARLEAGLLLPVFLVVARRRIRRDARAAAGLLAPGALVTAAYLAWNRLSFGLWLPVSGLVKTELVRGMPFPERLAAFLDWPWVGQEVLHAMRGPQPAPVANLALLGAAGAAIWAVRGPIGRGIALARGEWLVASAALWVLADVAIVVSVEPWNSVPILLVTALLVGAALHERPRLAGIAAGVLVAGACAFGARGFVRLGAPSASYATYRFQAALWIREHLGPAERLGSWNAGLVGYFSRHAVVNLDGLVNDRDYLDSVIRGHALEAYLDREGIGWLADQACGSDPSPRIYLARTGNGALADRFEPVAAFLDETAGDRCPGYAVWRRRPGPAAGP